jgi:uncharacterized membrane protein
MGVAPRMKSYYPTRVHGSNPFWEMRVEVGDVPAQTRQQPTSLPEVTTSQGNSLK